MGNAGAHLLIVDDNELNRDMLARRLERQGYEVTAVEDGHQALDALKENKIDLVLLDIMMPELSGYEVLERIKSTEATRHIPVIMISAVDELSSVVRCLEMGADDYLFKPFNPQLIRVRIEAALSRNRDRVLPRQDIVERLHSNVLGAQAALGRLDTHMDAKSPHRADLEELRLHLESMMSLIAGSF